MLQLPRKTIPKAIGKNARLSAIIVGRLATKRDAVRSQLCISPMSSYASITEAAGVLLKDGNYSFHSYNGLINIDRGTERDSNQCYQYLSVTVVLRQS